MQLLAYILIYPFLLIISLLPFRLLYLLSDIVFVIIYHIIGYRKTTVTSNLKLVFPEKSDKEVLSIKKKFYKHMCDMFLEMIKTLSITKKQLNARFNITNLEELKKIELSNKSTILIYGHYASYEWSIELSNHTKLKTFAVYKQIKNTYFDALVKRIRSKFNTSLIHTKETISRVIQTEKNNIQSIYGFLSDQSPKNSQSVYRTEFMGINVPCFTGAEKLAKKLDLSVTYIKINKVKRGFYEAKLIPLADNAKDYKDFEITDAFLRLLESQIKEAPEYYLWTHKRWKHRSH